MQRAAEYALVKVSGDCNLITSDGAAATQTVKHLHVHIVPRRDGDGLTLPWSTQPSPDPLEKAVAEFERRGKSEEIVYTTNRQGWKDAAAYLRSLQPQDIGGGDGQ
jgi:diadenosine tetraphosphate (Ap4A) HIT family hydrolase